MTDPGDLTAFIKAVREEYRDLDWLSDKLEEWGYTPAVAVNTRRALETLAQGYETLRQERDAALRRAEEAEARARGLKEAVLGFSASGNYDTWTGTTAITRTGVARE